MKAARWAPVSLLIALAAVACTASAGAETPPTRQPDAEPTRSGGSIATSVPSFGLPTSVLPTATAAGARSTQTPSPRSTATATPGRSATATRGPQATPGAPQSPTATAAAQPSAVPTTQPSPTVVSAPGDPYKTILTHSYTVPAGWSRTFTQDSAVITDPSGKIVVKIKETLIERWRYPTVSILGLSLFPDRPAGWTQWSSTSTGTIKNSEAYEFQFVGTRNGVSYIQFVHWYLWGDVHVEVSAEVPAFDWSSSTSTRNQVQSVMEGFVPHTGSSLMTVEDVLGALYVRLDNRPSGIYARDEVIRGRVELTCRDIYETLLGEPFYVGNGMWQASAYTLEGVETWWVFEPTGTLMAVNSNISRC